MGTLLGELEIGYNCIFGIHIHVNTVNVEIFALYIFSRNSRFLEMRGNIFNMKNTFIIGQRAKNTKNANFNPSEIAHFVKSTTIYTRENIYVYST